MTLRRRYLRGIRENLSFYVSATILTILTLLMFFLFEIAGTSILNYADEFYASQKREDAHFTTYTAIPQEDISDLEEEFDLELEPQQYLNVETDGTTARIFSATEKIDLYQITEGRDLSQNGEIIISEGYAVKNGVEIGDTIPIGEKEYRVTGFFLRPDYLYLLENESDSYKNITTFFLCYMTEEDFARMGQSSCQYLVRYHDTDRIQEFRETLYDRYYTSGYVSAEENQRIVMVEMQAKMFLVMSYILLCILPLIAVALIAIIISRKVKSEQRLVGTLSAMGYKKGRLMRHYAGFAALPGIFGGVLSAVAAVFAAQPYAELGLQDYEPMRVVGRLQLLPALLGVLIPTAMYILAALLAVRRLLKHDTVEMLAGSVGNEKRHRRILSGSKAPVKLKFALRTLLGSPARSFVILLGIFLGGFIALLGFSIFDTVDGMVDVTNETVGSYQYEYILSDLSGAEDYGGEPVLVVSMETEDGRSVSLMGTDSDNPYLDLKSPEGEKTDVEDGYYVSSILALVTGWEAGDQVTLYNPLSMEESRITISGVVQNDIQAAIFTGRDQVTELVGLPEGCFNGLLAAKPLEIPSDKVSREIRKAALAEQVKTMTDQMGALIYAMIGLGCVICIASIYVAINMLVTENRNNISMLKVLGYRNRRIDGMVLTSSHILLPIGYVLSIPAAYGCMNLFCLMMADIDNIRMTTAISGRSYLLTAFLVCLSYFGSLFLLRRKINRVDMIESLKDNRE